MPYVAGPFDSTHLYVQWGGKLPGPEEWSCGFRMRKKTSGAVDSGAALLAGVSAAIATFHAAPVSFISAAAKLSYVKVNAIGTDGHYVGTGTNEALYADLPGGSAGVQLYPNQIALAISLTTGFSRGPAHRGRFYMPLPTCTMGADSRLNLAQVDAIRDSALTLQASVDAVNADYEMAVFSRKLGAPANRKITGVQVGRVLDTQRRRRRSLVEAYE